MVKQAGFTLFELMISISVIAVLSAVAVPAYQGYIQKAALTDVLQTMSAYKMGVELCYLDNGEVNECKSGQFSIPPTKTTRYIKEIQVEKGVISIVGQSAIVGLSLTLTPTLDPALGELTWQRNCQIQSGQQSLLAACKDLFRFQAGES